MASSIPLAGDENEDALDDMPDLPMTDPLYIAWTQRVQKNAKQRLLGISPVAFRPYQQVIAKPFFEIKTAKQAGAGIFSLGTDENGQSVAIPPSINRFLREYQREGVRFFWEHYKRKEGGLLGDDMGLGKTIQVIAFLTAIMRGSTNHSVAPDAQYVYQITTVQKLSRISEGKYLQSSILLNTEIRAI